MVATGNVSAAAAGEDDARCASFEQVLNRWTFAGEGQRSCSVQKGVHGNRNSDRHKLQV
jgi:hypothetical protein